MITLHNLRHVYFLPKFARGQARAYSIFPAPLARENRPITRVVTQVIKIESWLPKVELGSTLCNMLPQLATLKFVT